MKALTIWQPWASLLAYGAKRYETRSWATKYRGPIAIHAAEKDPNLVMAGLLDECLEKMAKALHNSELVAIPRACIIATAKLVGCYEIVSVSNSGFVPNGCKLLSLRDCGLKGCYGFPVSGDEILFGNFTPGRYAWEFANMKMLPEPIPARGYQRLWDWDEAGL